MIRKVKKKSGIRKFAALLLMVVIAVFFYEFIITLGSQHIFEKKYDDNASSYSSLKITPDSSDDGTVPVLPSKIEIDHSDLISPDKLNSPNAILVRLKDHTILMQKK